MGIFTEALIPFGERYIKPIAESGFKFLKGGIESGGDVAVNTLKSPLFKKVAIGSGAGLVGFMGLKEASKLGANSLENLTTGINTSLSNIGFKMPKPQVTNFSTGKTDAPTQTTPKKKGDNTPVYVAKGITPTNKPVVINLSEPKPTTNTGFFNFNNILLLGALGGGIFLIGKYISKNK